MINRRHIIVHNADLSRDTTPLVNPISRNDVDLWLGNVAEITGKMLAVGVMLD